MSQMELFKPEEIEETSEPNPMVQQLGKGPKGTTCESCRHLKRNTSCGLTAGAGVLPEYNSCRMYKAAKR